MKLLHTEEITTHVFEDEGIVYRRLWQECWQQKTDDGNWFVVNEFAAMKLEEKFKKE